MLKRAMSGALFAAMRASSVWLALLLLGVVTGVLGCDDDGEVVVGLLGVASSEGVAAGSAVSGVVAGVAGAELEFETGCCGCVEGRSCMSAGAEPP